jgi:NapC/NirT cytochrome c family, N-terminal region
MSSSVFVDQVSALVRSVVAWFRALGATPLLGSNALVIASVVAGLIMAGLIVAIVRMPAKRKVVHKRRVRRVRRRVVAAQPMSTHETEPAASLGEAPAPVKSRRRMSVALMASVWAVLVLLTVVATYALTGSDGYCGESCHGGDKHVALALKYRHASCVACHEPDPVSGLAARFRMAISQVATKADVVGTPVDPALCLRCHQNTVSTVVATKTGVRVSHKEILAGGRTCTDCHVDVGHRKGRSFVGGMSGCTACHDGVVAKRTCPTCHSGGSPLSTPGAATRANSPFDYPALRVANRNCAACHGAEKQCVACHNGLVLPHPAAFVQGGHARMAAFSGKDICFKCHSLAWCGDTRCHNGFSAHDEKTWRLGHQTGTSAQCGSCHTGWNGKGDFCKVCH